MGAAEVNEEDGKAAGWSNTVQFLRANPKLMMEMIPGTEDDPPLGRGNMTKGR